MTVDYKVKIANFANASLGDFGQRTLTSLSGSTDPKVQLIAAVLEDVIKYLMTDDWYFNQKRVKLDYLTQVHLLVVEEDPTADDFAIGDTLTGDTSAKTCTVVDILNHDTYLVTEPSGDLTVGETLSDGTNSAVLESISDILGLGHYNYGYVIPTDYLLNRGISSEYSDKLIYKTKREGNIILSQTDDGIYHYNKYIGTSGVSDIDDLPIWFHRLISARLAFVMSANITENLKIRPKAEMDWNIAYLEAKEKNGMEESKSNEDNEEDKWGDSVHNYMDNL